MVSNQRILFLLLWLMVSIGHSIAQNNHKLSAAAFSEKIKATPDAVLLDVRTPREYRDGYIANSQNIDYDGADFRAKIKTLDKSKTYFVYCLSGGRSSSATRYMHSKGFKNVYELQGGILKWTYPMEGTEKSEATPDQISATGYSDLTTSEQLVVIDFYAPWCGPCKKMKPMLEQLAKDYKGKVNVVRINIDENKRLIKSLGISEIPVVRIYKGGKEQWNRVGLTERRAIVDQLSKL